MRDVSNRPTKLWAWAVLGSLLGGVSGLIGVPGAAVATDTSKLSIYQPLTVQDAYPTSTGTVQAQTSVSWDETKDGHDLVTVRPVLKWGAFEHLQIAAGGPYLLGNTDSSGSGDPFLGVTYQFAEDRGLLPAMAFSQSVHQYYGALQGTEPVSTFLATKSLTGSKDGTEIHLNVSYRHHFDGALDDRHNRTRFVVGISQPIGDKLTVLADFVRQQDRQIGDLTNLIEVGFRREIAKDSVISLGAGVGIGVDSRRARVLIGFQHAFHLSGS
jgi:hypothetical protein